MYIAHRRHKRFVDLPLFTGRTFTLFVLFFTLVMEALISELHFPSSIHYVNDLFVVSLFITVAVRPGRAARLVGVPIVVAALVTFLVFTTSAIVNEVDFALYLWALRNTFRGVVFFFACVTYLGKEDLPLIFDKLFVLQLVSLVIALYQRFVLKLNMDATGGIFGRGNGAGVNPFNALLFAYYLNQYLADKIEIKKLAVITGASLVIAAVAEEKFTFVIYVAIALISILFAKASRKLTIAVLVVAVAVCVGMSVLKTLSPNMFDVLTSGEAMEGYLTSTSSGGYELPRVGSFAVIDRLIFNHDLQKELLGVGFGNGETSSFSFLVGPYFERYGYLHYRWFTHQWTFFECGYLGFFSYLAFFVVVACTLFVSRFKYKKNERHMLTCGLALAVSVIASIWYNSGLKNDMSYIAYFSLAIGFIAMKIETKEVA